MQVAREAGEDEKDEEVCIQKEGEYLMIDLKCPLHFVIVLGYFNFLWSSFITGWFQFFAGCWLLENES